MRRIVAVFIAAICLAACKPDNTYTGEPFVHIEYTVDGQHYVYEDWGHLEYYSMEPYSFGSGIRLLNLSSNQSVAIFELKTNDMSLLLASNGPVFIDGRRYEYYYLQNTKHSTFRLPADAVVSDGWFSITRHTTEPYCRYDVRFELHANGNNREYDITDGIIQVGRRFQGNDVKNLIKQEEQ